MLMANPIIPGIPEAEQGLLQVLIWWCCPILAIPVTHYGFILHYPNASLFFTFKTFLQISMKVCG